MASSPTNKTPIDGTLYTAIQAGDLTGAQQALADGANVNAGGGRFGGDTPLMVAAQSENVAMVKLLLDAGADVNHWCLDSGFHPLLYANGHPEIVRLLVEHGAEVNDYRVMQSVRRRSPELAALLYEHGYDPQTAHCGTRNIVE